MRSLVRRRKPQSPAVEHDEGMGLIEVIVSMALAAVVLLALLQTSIFALKSSADARKNQQAGDYLNGAVEAIRSLAYGGISMRTGDLADSRIVTVAGVPKFDPGTGLEPLDVSATGVVYPHVQAAAQGRSDTNGDYVISRYVTVPASATFDDQGVPSLRRLTVIVTWTSSGIDHVRKSSTLVTNTRRGLPLPSYRWIYNGPATLMAGTPTWTKNPGNDVEYGFVLTNLGARDSWSLTASNPGWTFYLDTDKDGLWSEDLAVEPLLTPANSGLVEPGDAPIYVVARRILGDFESGTTSTTFTATSDAQPTFPSKSVVTTLSVMAGTVAPPTPAPTPTPSPTGPASACNPGTNVAVSDPGTGAAAVTGTRYTQRRLYVYNGSSRGDSMTLANTAMGLDGSALLASPCNFSTDQQTDQAGRLLRAGGSGTNGKIEWRFQPASGAEDEFSGTAVVVLYVQCPLGSGPTLTVALGTLVGATDTERATASRVPSGCNAGNFVRLDVPIVLPASFPKLALSSFLTLKVTTSTDVRLLYNVQSAPGRFVIGVK